MISQVYHADQEEGKGGQLLEQRLLRIREVVAYTGVSDTTLRRAVANGHLRAYKLPGGLRFRREDVERWIESYTIIPQPRPVASNRKLSEIFAAELA